MASLYVVGGLKIAHVVFAAAWFGTLVGFHLGIRPALAAAGGRARAEVSGLVLPRSLRLGNAFGGLTLLSGVALLYGMTGGLRPEGQWGRYVAAAFLLNLGALYLLNFAMRPTLRMIAKLMAKEDPTIPPPAPVAFLQRRLAFSSMMMIGLTGLAIALMVWADVSRSL